MILMYESNYADHHNLCPETLLYKSCTLDTLVHIQYDSITLYALDAGFDNSSYRARARPPSHTIVWPELDHHLLYRG